MGQRGFTLIDVTQMDKTALRYGVNVFIKTKGRRKGYSEDGSMGVAVLPVEVEGPKKGIPVCFLFMEKEVIRRHAVSPS